MTKYEDVLAPHISARHVIARVSGVNTIRLNDRGFFKAAS